MRNDDRENINKDTSVKKDLSAYKRRTRQKTAFKPISVFGVPEEHLRALRAAGLNISAICRDALADAVERLKKGGLKD